MRAGDEHIPVGVDPEVWNWLSRRSTRGGSWTLQRVVRAKGTRRISVVLPARDEEQTVGGIVAEVRRRLVEDVRLVDEVIVINSRSCGATASVAASAGATVYHQDHILPGQPRMEGKGDALWKGLAASTGDIVLFVDSDLRDFTMHFMVGLLGPLLCEAGVVFVKAHYLRPLVTGQVTVPGGGGRVTELVARPLINMFWPHLAGFVQPLAGEYGGYRHVLEKIPFATGYGVEFAMLIDLFKLLRLDALAQVDLGTRTHRHNDIEALGRMAARIYGPGRARNSSASTAVSPKTQASRWLTQFRHDTTSPVRHQLRVSDVAVQERPPLADVRALADLLTAAPGACPWPLAHPAVMTITVLINAGPWLTVPPVGYGGMRTSVTITRAAGNNDDVSSPAGGKPGSRLSYRLFEGMREATIIRRACHNSPRTRRGQAGADLSSRRSSGYIYAEVGCGRYPQAVVDTESPSAPPCRQHR